MCYWSLKLIAVSFHSLMEKQHAQKIHYVCSLSVKFSLGCEIKICYWGYTDSVILGIKLFNFRRRSLQNDDELSYSFQNKMSGVFLDEIT